MQHKCAVNEADPVLDEIDWFHKLKMLSPTNPQRLSYFRSDVSVREEQRRHLRVNKYAIHPFSRFRAWYEVYLIFLYTSVLITKPLDAAFIRHVATNELFFYRVVTVFIDLLFWIDIFLNFTTGFECQNTRTIEIRKWHIIKHYIFGPYFIFDVVSSVPKSIMYGLSEYSMAYKSLVEIVSFLSLFKAVRTGTYVNCIRRTAEYYRILSKGVLFLVCSIVVSCMIIHWMACMQFAVPKLIRMFLLRTGEQSLKTVWFLKDMEGQILYNEKLVVQYTHCIFKSSAYILGIRLNLYTMNLPEEYILAIFTYFIGKILIASIWIILAVAILNSRLMDIKFAEIMNQLEEYMRQKQLPLNLQNRILQYFIFKYRFKYFKEHLITSLLSENLRRETNLYVCKALIKNVSLFSELTPLEVSKVVEYLIPEIFLPNDTIIHAGTQGDAMYFLSSGTVAVYTRSGREICHLQDGAYFGEISLILKGQLRLATIVALEASHVYRLNKKDLEKCLLTNKDVRLKILKHAEARLKETAKLEEEYKEMLFEQSFRGIGTTSGR